MAFDVDRFTDALMLGTKMLIAKELAPLRAENEALRGMRAELEARVAALEARETPTQPDLSPLHDGLQRVADAVAALPPSPDLSGLATKAELEDVRAAIPGAPDLSGFATKADIPAAPDLSGLATKAEIEEVRSAIPVLPEAPDLSVFATKDDVAEVRGAIPTLPEAPDLSGLATKDDVAEAVAAIRIPEAIKVEDADPEAVAALVMERITPSLEAIDTELADAVRRVDARLAEVKDGEPGKDGMLPLVDEWRDAVHYRGAVVTHGGSLWQAVSDTGREPPHADWRCLAASGRDGLSPEFVGTFEDGAEYRRLDVVAMNGGSFVALRDNPGPCPGEGWQLVAGRGKPGPVVKGDKGDKGDPGRDASEVVGVYRDGDEIVVTLGDGREMRA